MKLDPPFSFHRPLPNNKSVLIGGQAEELKILFEELYRLSLVNPIMTAIVGNPGTGKTHFLWNLEDRTNEGERDGFALIYELKDKKPTTGDIIEFIHEHELFRQLAKKSNVVLTNNKKHDTIKRSNEINQVIKEINKENNGNFGICLGIDIVDEYVRKQTGDYRNVSDVIVDLVVTFRLILDFVDKICIVFALTKDVYMEMRPIIHGDQTLRRRFVIPNGLNGEPVEFGQLNEFESYNLVSTFMKYWGKRNQINIEELFMGDETWPFDKSAIKLAWRIAPTPGGLSFVCMGAIIEKISADLSAIEQLKISELDIARYLQKNKTYSDFIDDDERIWSDIDFLVNKSIIEKDLSKLKNESMDETKGEFSKSILQESFEKYFISLGYLSESGNSDLIIGKNVEKLDKRIGIKFVYGAKIHEDDGKPISKDMSESKIDAGLFVCLTENESAKVQYDDYFELIFNKINSKNYNPTLDSKIIVRDDILFIIGLRKLNDESRMRYVGYLDKKLKLGSIIESLNFVIPA